MLVPELQAHRPHPVAERERRHGVDARRLVCGLQVVVGYARAQMVDVVQADVAREEAEHPWQVEVRAALERRRVEAPRSFVCQ